LKKYQEKHLGVGCTYANFIIRVCLLRRS